MNKIQYKAPKKAKIFKKYWNKLLPKVIERENFHEGYLQQLEVLCDLYVQYEKLMEFLMENGFSFMTSGRYGDTSRPYAETQMLPKVLCEIRQYSRLLGLVLVKDTSKNLEDSLNEWK